MKNFNFYAPPKAERETCDPNWTNTKHPCRGTFFTCRKGWWLKAGIPNDKKCCWRFSYRYQLEKASFLLQVIEWSNDKQEHFLGEGQKIEAAMANDVGIKTFRIFQQKNIYGEKILFDSIHVDTLAESVRIWYLNTCLDVKKCDIFFPDWEPDESVNERVY